MTFGHLLLQLLIVESQKVEERSRIGRGTEERNSKPWSVVGDVVGERTVSSSLSGHYGSSEMIILDETI